MSTIPAKKPRRCFIPGCRCVKGFNAFIVLPSADDPEHEVDVQVHAHCYPGAPERGPSYDSGGEPAEPPEVDLIDATDEAGTDWLPALRERDAARAKEVAKLPSVARLVAWQSQEERIQEEIALFIDRE